jgi:RNA polymerase sigma factor (sigma-70 family)
MTPKLGGIQFDATLASDAMLVAVVAERNERLDAAFEELHRRHYRRVVSFLAFARSISMSEAEDATSEAFLVVFQQAARFDDSQASFRTWLYRIALNKATDLRRARKREHGPTVDQLAHKLVSSAGILAEKELLVGSCMRRLNNQQRCLVLLKYFDGFTEEEISTMLQVPVGTIATKLRAARRNLHVLVSGSATTSERRNKAPRRPMVTEPMVSR